MQLIGVAILDKGLNRVSSPKGVSIDQAEAKEPWAVLGSRVRKYKTVQLPTTEDHPPTPSFQRVPSFLLPFSNSHTARMILSPRDFFDLGKYCFNLAVKLRASRGDYEQLASEAGILRVFLDRLGQELESMNVRSIPDDSVDALNNWQRGCRATLSDLDEVVAKSSGASSNIVKRNWYKLEAVLAHDVYEFKVQLIMHIVIAINACNFFEEYVEPSYPPLISSTNVFGLNADSSSYDNTETARDSVSKESKPSSRNRQLLTDGLRVPWTVLPGSHGNSSRPSAGSNSCR